MSDPDEAKELRLVNNVELKIALAEGDDKLQRLLNLYLPPLLLKLASPHVSVRNKVISICQHVNTRIKPPTLILPVAALLAQFKDPQIGGKHPLVRNFDLMYVQIGIERLPVSERLALLSPLLKDISKHNNATHQRALFNILLKLLPYFEPPPRGTNEDGALRATLGFEEGPEDAVYIASWLAKLMLLNLSVFSQSQSQPEQQTQRLSCPGLSSDDFEFLTVGGKKETFTPFSVLADIKKSALKFLASGAFTDRERFFVTLVAASDSNSAVSEPAEDIFKRSLPSVSLDNEEVVAELYSLYFGSPAAGVPPVKVVLQARIVILLAKSQTAVSEKWKGEIVRIVESGLETEYARLRQAAFSFVNWASRMGGEAVMAAVAGDVVERVRYWILSTGYEDGGGGGGGGDELRGYAYESLGLLAKRAPDIVIEPEWKILKFLFGRLRDEPAGSVGVSVEGALSTLLPVIAKARMDRDVQEGLEELIVEQMVAQKGRSTRFTAVRYANRTLEFGNVVGRWANLLAVGRKRERGEVVEEAKKGLHPYYYRLLNPEEKHPAYSSKNFDTMDVDFHPPAEKPDKFAFPSFPYMVNYFFNGIQHNATTWGPGDRLVANIMPIEVFSTALAFVRRVAFMEALGGEEIVVDEDWERKLDIAVERDDKIRTKIRAFFQRIAAENPRVLERFMGVAWEGMVYEGIGIEGVRDVWVELVGVVPGVVLEGFVGRVADLRKCAMAGIKLEGRATTARAIGFIGSHEAVPQEVLQTLLEEVEASAGNWEKAGGQELNRVHGGILAVGYLLARLKLRGRLEILEKAVIEQSVGAILAALLGARDQTILDAAITAFSEVCVFGVVDGDYFSNSEKILDRLVELGKKGKEKAILALGYFAIVFSEDVKGDMIQKILEKLFSMHESRQIEVNFATGEALAAVAGGWQSKGVKGKIDLEGFESAMENVKNDRGRLQMVVEKVLSFVKETKPALRKATCVWMLSLLEFLGDSVEIQSKLGEMQKGFRGFLVDRDDLVQETAARGLTMVYERGDKETKDDLVKSLISSFTGERRALTGNVSADTELFEPGALPTGDGSISTYKDIMSLASEVGDPSLVYKFMSLARHNSLWSSRAAFGRFGLGSILSSSDVLKNNPKLYPKLYRYRFDPNPNVAKSMEDIWKSLIGGEEREILDVWFESILEDLLEQALGREWRTRESCCTAIGELVQGRGIEKYAKYLERIWSVAFKVLDDVKESVREAAMKLCRVLTAAMIKNVDVNAGSSPKDAETVLKSLMPFLMGGSGLEAGAKEVQIFALRTLLKLVKTGGKVVLPYVPSLVDKFVTLLSSLEPEAVNYLHLNADKYNTTGEDIDRMRLSNVRGSPMMDAIERCLDLLDNETMKTFIPQLQKTIRKALGLPSKVGCSRIIVTLVVRHGFVTKPYADDLMKTIQSSLQDRNETVMVSYASAVGYLCRIASDEKILGLVSHAKKLYFEGEDEKTRALASEIIYAISKHATDRFNALAAEVLPFLFVGKHDPEKSVNEAFGKAWSENTGGTGAIKLYLVEIVDMTKIHLGSQRWATKQTAALSLADACKSIGKDLSAEQLRILWPVLVSATSGKSWDGKEAVLDALVSLAVDGKAHFGSDAGKLQELRKIVLREAKRKNPSYRSTALQSLGSFANGFEELNIFAETYEIVEPSISQDTEDAMDIDVSDGRSAKIIQQSTLINGLSALSYAFQPKFHTSAEMTTREVLQMLDLLEIHMTGANYEIKTCGAEYLERIIEKLSFPTLKLDDRDWDTLLKRIWSQVLENSRDRGHENVRLKAASAIIGLLKLQGHGNIWGDIREDLRQTLAEERSSVVLQIMESAVTRFLLQ